jgi:stage V sporulation protein S
LPHADRGSSFVSLVWDAGSIGGPSFQAFRGFVNVDRFFSKLDLRDIKIDPFKASYPPDAEDVVEAETEYGTETEVVERPLHVQGSGARQPHTPAWAPVETESANGHDGTDTEEPYANGGVGNGGFAPAESATVVEHRNGDVLKVSARSRPSAVAGAIAGVVRENGRAEVQAIGAGATNQAVKAVAIARDYLRETGIEAICLPAFIDVTIENEDRTAIRLVVEPR